MLWIILAVLSWGIAHSLLASVKAKELVLNWLGETLANYYRLAYNLLAGLSFLPILILAAVAPDRKLYLVPLPWAVLMGLGEFLAAILVVAGLRQTGIRAFLGLQQIMGNATSVQPDRTAEAPKSQLITSGLYRYIRHPLYSAGLLFIWLLPVMTVNLLTLNLSLTVYIIIGAYFEERKLRREFGRDYSDYADHTPMFIPFLKGNKTSH